MVSNSKSRFIQHALFPHLFDALLLVLLVVGLSYRFRWINWSEGTNLHPDEYGLTNTLTQLRMPSSLSEYFNTRLSPLSPYPKYDLEGQIISNGPDNRMRWGQWPMIIIRGFAELTGNTGYNDLRLMGRYLSAIADTLSILFIFLIGKKLYNFKIGLLAACLSSLAVLQIQQSHFMTVDNFGVLFATLGMYICVQISQKACVYRERNIGTPQTSFEIQLYKPDRNAWKLYFLFGIAFGMAITSKINLIPLGGMVFIGSFISISDLKLKIRNDIYRIFGITSLHILLAFVTAVLTFRITQPMSFRQQSGDTTFFSFHLNSDWLESMKIAQTESNGIGGGPPAEQWAHRPAIIFPLVNMVLWGMGIPLGIMAWIGLIWAGFKIFKDNNSWKLHSLPIVWAGGYFAFMATRWVKSIRYFLPIYPFLCLLAAWGLIELYNLSRKIRQENNYLRRSRIKKRQLFSFVSVLVIAFVLLGALGWAFTFTNAVYQREHTRIQATRWILQEIPAPFHLAIERSDGSIYYEPISAPNGLHINASSQYEQSFISSEEGILKGVTIPHAKSLSDQYIGQLLIAISSDPEGRTQIDKATTSISIQQSSNLLGSEIIAEFHNASIEKGKTYYLIASAITDKTDILISRTVISNESWDEGLPLPLEGYDPFGQFYNGITMEIRWYDDENKRKMMIDTLNQADYIILPSQRAIWTTCRIPMTYPMTMAYYRALFDGRLGYDLVASFSAPFKIGSLYISDVGGTIGWGQFPDLPLFNNSQLAAEEAFSVYDHPPVWIFKKGSDFTPEKMENILYSVDLSRVVIQSARDASLPPCK